MTLLIRSLLRWLPIAVACTAVLGASYGFAQQVYRMGADDPQTAMAASVAAQWLEGQEPDKLVSKTTVDPSTSLEPFVILFDAAQKPIASSARLSGETPVPPKGVLEASKESGENKVTWQPQGDTRIAAVIVPVEAGARGFVLVGRSLRVVEERISGLATLAWMGWLVTMVASFAAVVLTQLVVRRAARRTA